jgi:hypothetical protein
MKRDVVSWRARPVAGIALLCSLLWVAGCGKPTGTLSGVVKLGPTTLKGGSVTFHPSTGNVVRAEIGQDGRYTTEGVPVGDAKVTVETLSVSRPKMMPKEAEKSIKKAGGSGGNPGLQFPTGERYVPIPKRYGDPKSTSLKVTVTGGAQVYDISMSSP